MKILEDYNKFAFELLFEVDDEKIINYKDKDGESKEMKAGSAKTMPKDHPAKQVWDKMNAQDGDDDKEEPSDKKLGGSDFDRDGGDDKPKTPSADDYDSTYGTRNQSGGGFQKPRSDEPKGDDKYVPDTKNADDAKKELADISVDLDTHEGDIPKSIKRRIDNHTQDIMAQQGIYKNDDGKFATDDGKVLSDDSVNKMLSRETKRTENEVGYMLDKAGLSSGDEPKDKSGDSKEAPSAVNPDLKSQFTDEELEDVPFGHRKKGSFNDKTEEMEQEISMELEQLYGVDEDGEYDDDKAETVRAEAELLYAEFGGTKGNIIPDEFQTLKGYRDKLMKNIENRFAMIEKKPLPHKTGSSYFEKKPEKKNRGTMGSVGVRQPGQAGSGMYDSVQPKKKPFLKEQLERFGGLK